MGRANEIMTVKCLRRPLQHFGVWVGGDKRVGAVNFAEKERLPRDDGCGFAGVCVEGVDEAVSRWRGT